MIVMGGVSYAIRSSCRPNNSFASAVGGDVNGKCPSR
jgi:hypothetical protein